jgi:heat-inducible transcriptional repressor
MGLNAVKYDGYNMLRSRTESVLKILINEYISTVTPVASEDIVQRLPQRVSPATIRNEMSELENEGYITRPHISAGAIPSDKGYRFYVESLEDTPELPVMVQQQIRDQFSRTQRDQEAWIQLAATVLARVTDNLAIVTFPHAASSTLKYIHLVYLQEFLALLIVVFHEARLKQQLLTLSGATNQSELTQVANKLNENLTGLTSSHIQNKQLELTPLEELVKADTVSILKDVDAEAAFDHYVDGLRLLLGQPEFGEGHRAQRVVEILEERVLLRSILSETPDQGSMGVFIGEENQEEPLRSFGVIVSQYGIPNQASGTVSVIGPTRMEYGNVIGGVKFFSSFLSELVSGVHGRS